MPYGGFVNRVAWIDLSKDEIDYRPIDDEDARKYIGARGLDVCKFATFAQSLDSFAAQYAAITGHPWTANDLLLAGERVYNLERHFNNLNGFDCKDDTLPQRFLLEPFQESGSKGHVCELETMLNEYHEARGWVDGVVPEAKLKELEIIA